MIRRPPRSTLSSSSAASDVYKRQSLRQPIPTSITLVNASAALQELYSSTLEASRTNNQPGVSHITIGRISKEKHRLLSSAIVEFTFGNKDPLLSLIHISEPTRLLSISYAVFCLKKKKKKIYCVIIS
eukprot:TRINITY_DN63288_c0_g1_i1.p1 TRINITY_DN63288_c0_g1~~TRINITY_DN63288_c0_g1_i1.p1  ORF type:complete len:128 (+),score=31.94 TRINITY_DN63288_c0_g1_i1:87-470(+)